MTKDEFPDESATGGKAADGKSGDGKGDHEERRIMSTVRELFKKS